MITTAFAPAIPWLWVVRARCARNSVVLRRVSPIIFFAVQVRRFAVDQKAGFAAPGCGHPCRGETSPVARCQRRAFSTRESRSVDRVYQRATIPRFAALLDRLRIDFVGLLFFHVDEQIALPQAYQQQAFFLRVINIPGLWRFVIELHDGEPNRFPKELLSADCERAGRGKAQIAKEKGQEPRTNF